MNKVFDLFNVFSKEKPAALSPLKLEDLPKQITQCPDKETIINAFEEWALTFAGLSELGGNTNRADYIDEFNMCTGAGLGKAYCVSAYMFRRRQIENEFGIKFDLPFCAGSQQFWSQSKTMYRHKEPARGRFALFQSAIDKTQGHFALCLSDQLESGKFNTFEFNTSGMGSRNGMYQMRKTRTVGMNGSLILLGFVDFADAFSMKNA